MRICSELNCLACCITIFALASNEIHASWRRLLDEFVKIFEVLLLVILFDKLCLTFEFFSMHAQGQLKAKDAVIVVADEKLVRHGVLFLVQGHLTELAHVSLQ